MRFEYDANSNLTKVTDPRGGEIVYTYTTMDWLDTRTDQLGRQEHYTYDLAGNVTQFQDRKNQFTNWAAYDARNRPTTVTYQDASTMTYNYDAAGRLWQLTDSLSGTITRTFDALDRMTQEQTPQGVITYAPDDADRRTTMTVAGQPPVSYSWDTANRLQSIIRDTLTASYAYDDANRRTSVVLPNGVTIGYGYDEANRLTGLTYSGLAGDNQNLAYAYDPAGNRVRTGGSWARTLLPAAITTASYDAANRQLTLGGKSMTYDYNGNLQTLTEAGQTTTYTWDARDRLIALSGPGLSASFAYDAMDRRTQKTVQAFTTTFQYDRLHIVRESEGPSTIGYLRGPRIDETLARIDEGGAACYVPDTLGSTLALTDAAGAVATEYTYEPFGQTSASGAVSHNALQYTGRENDGTGLYYYRARYYNPSVSRFVREDPVGIRDGINLFAYVKNNPVNRRDPSGHSAKDDSGNGHHRGRRNPECDILEEEIRLLYEQINDPNCPRPLRRDYFRQVQNKIERWYELGCDKDDDSGNGDRDRPGPPVPETQKEEQKERGLVETVSGILIGIIIRGLVCRLMRVCG